MTTPIIKYLKARTDVKSVFGTYTIADDSSEVSLAADDNSVYDYILRDPTFKSLENEIQQAQFKGLVNLAPKEYITAMKNDLFEIRKKLSAMFQIAYQELLSNSYTQSEAKKLANQKVEKDKEFLMALHKKKFPYSLKDFKGL